MDTKRFTLDTTLTLIAAYLGLFVGLIDANAINLALPAIRDNLGGGISGAQWTIDAYNITFAAVLLTAGSLGDRFGRRTLLRVGLVTFIVASLVCAAAPSLPLLLAARAVQGVGAGLMLLQGLGYLPESRDPDAASFDVPGQTLAMVGLGALTIVLVEGRTMAPDVDRRAGWCRRRRHRCVLVEPGARDASDAAAEPVPQPSAGGRTGGDVHDDLRHLRPAAGEQLCVPTTTRSQRASRPHSGFCRCR